jgi:hypothetical protein
LVLEDEKKGIKTGELGVGIVQRVFKIDEGIDYQLILLCF